MRLQLIVQRHGLPPAQILWTVGAAVKPPNGAPGTSITISQFLEQVNEVIPLEADQWGLEDYAVGVQGFECLHFSELSQVLKEDDEICIRPLQTSDLRVRKFSGRHQISADGKHLIDGVAFGRPFLKRTDRPAVRIPPRKKKRIVYSEEDDSILDAENNDRQVVVRAGFDNADKGEDEDETDDEDFDPGADDDEDLDAGAEDDEGLENELEGLQNDLQPDEEEAFDSARRTRKRSRRKSTGLGLEFFGDGTYYNPLLDQYSQDEPLTGPSVLKDGNRASRETRKVSSSKNAKSGLGPQRFNRRDSAGSSKSVHFEDGEPATPATLLEAEIDDDEEDDDDFHPVGFDGSPDLDESDKENTEPTEDAIGPLDSSDSTSSFSEFDPSENELEDETSSSGTSSDSDPESDSAPDQLSSKVEEKGRADDSSSSSSSTSSSYSGSDGGKQDKEQKPATDDGTPSTSVGEIGTESKERLIVNPPVPPGSGKHSTRIRNLRRKASAALKFHKAKGNLPEDATSEDLIRLKEQDGSPMPPWMVEMRSKVESSVSRKANDRRNRLEKEKENTAKIAAKRQALLTSLASGGGVDVTTENGNTNATALAVQGKPTHVPEATEEEQFGQPADCKRQIEENDDPIKSQNVEGGSSSNTVQVPDTLPKDPEPTPARADVQPVDVPLPSSTPLDTSSDPASAFSGSQRRRAKLDLAGSKRLLFGSLGLKAPKTKVDESALREKLMKNVRPVKLVKERVAEIEAAEAGAVSPENDEDSWKDKIELAAVECCHDDIELSTPPFPFVQRWDPQQQRIYPKKKGKRNKKRKRMDRSYHEEDYEESPNPGSPSKVARQENYDPNVEQPQFDAAAFEQDQAQRTQEWSHDQSIQDSVDANEQLLRETTESAAYAIAEPEQVPEAEGPPDLPSLPDDLSECQELKKQHCIAGTIIAFKKFLMSAETNWQPGISGYLTATVHELKEDGTLVAALARRDQPKSEARYHEETGERLYGKFEMPGFDEENADHDGSRLEMPFNELISPLLIRPENNYPNSSEGEIAISSKPDDALVGDEAQRPITETQASVSFDSSLENLVHQGANVAAPTESARQEIVEMIQDAGWRSSLNSCVGKELRVNGHTVSFQRESQDDATPMAFQSPNSGEFNSSPHANGFHSASSPLLAGFQESKTQQTLGAEATHQEPGEENASSALSASKKVVEYPTLPHSIEESELFQDQQQHRSVSLDNDRQPTPQGFVSPPPIRRGRGQKKFSPIPRSQSQKPAESAPKPISTLDGTSESSDEFPELFSQAFEARMSQEPVIKDESSQKHDMYRVPKKRGKLDSSQKSSHDSGSWKTELSGFEGNAENDGSFGPSQSQFTLSSQIVDLTISSDPLDSMPDENEGMSSYKASSGSADKPKANKDIGVAKRLGRRKTRSTSAMA